MRFNALPWICSLLLCGFVRAAAPPTEKFDERQFVIEWEMRSTDGAFPQGVLLEGNGFQIVGNKINVPPLLAVYFDQRYRGWPLKQFPRATPEPVRAKLTTVDRTPARYKIIYDLQRVQILRNGVPLELLGAGSVEWLDGMTDFVGTNGPPNVRIPKSNAAVTNVSVRSIPAPKPTKYTYLGSIGNTSSNFYGPSMHAAYQSIKSMVIHPNGTDAFYTTGYNENLYELQKFNPAHPQIVQTNFGRKITVLMGNALITNLAIAGNVLYAQRSDGVTDQYDTATCKPLGPAKGFSAKAMPRVESHTGVPLAWSQSPADGSIAIYDAALDVVRVYDRSGKKLLHSIGLTNGYANGPSILAPANQPGFRDRVKLGALWYDKQNRATNATVAFQPDGKLWVSDTTTGRMLRFTTNGGCDAWFMFVPHTYVASADPNAPHRVFNEYLEFRIDYNALSPHGGWVLTNYWGHDVARDDTMHNGLFNVTTISNRTYALIFDPAYENCQNGRRLAELTPTGLRVTSVSNLNCQFKLQPDGALHRLDGAEGHGDSVTFARRFITRIRPNGDPQYSEPKTLARVRFDRRNDPAEFDFKVAGDKLVVYDTAGTHKGFHLGAVLRTQESLWLWRALPSGPMNGRGNFDLEAQDAPGSEFVVVDNHIFAQYRGEFWKKGRQANQIFHFTTDGKFVGQFGMPAYSDTMPNAIGSGANMFTLSFAKTNGAIYLFTNDEKGRGTQVWRVEP